MINVNPILTALIWPTDANFYPGKKAWQESLAPYRKSVVRIHALIPAAGIQHEKTIIRNPQLMSYASGLGDRKMALETSSNIFAWLKSYGNIYQRIVLINWGPLMPLWSKGAKEVKSNKIKIIKIPRRGMNSVTRKKIAQALF